MMLTWRMAGVESRDAFDPSWFGIQATSCGRRPI